MTLEWQDTGIVLSLRPHGETGGILSLLTAGQGRVAGYVYGGGGNRLRSVLQPGNLVSATWQARAEGSLGTLSCELERSHAADALHDPLKLTALQSACALADRTLPEREIHAGVFEGLLALLESFDTDIWPAAYVYWELGLLRALGFGLDLSRCAATGGTEDLRYVSPKSGRAVSAAAGAEYRDRMLPLPGFLHGGGDFSAQDIHDGLRLTGHFLLHRVFSLSNANLPEPRLRLEEKYCIT